MKKQPETPHEIPNTNILQAIISALIEKSIKDIKPETAPKTPSVACVSFNGGINQKNANTLEAVISGLIEKGIKDIKIALSSLGGSVSCGMHLYEWLQSLKINVDTHNTGNVDSIANVVFLAGKKRTASPFSRFMLHGAVPASTAGFNEAGLQTTIEFIQGDQNRIAELIAKETRWKVEELKKIFKKKDDTIITPKGARRKGVIHKVENFKMPDGAISMIVPCEE